MAISQFMAAINQIADEKGLTKETIVEAVEAAIAAAYRKDYAANDDVIRATLEEDAESPDQAKLAQIFTVVTDEEFENEHYQMTLEEAKKHDRNAEIGDELAFPLEPHKDFGRIAAQTAKQVIIQRLREAEREMLFTEFKDRENKIATGSVQQLEGETVLVNLGRITAIMLPNDQIPNEHYYVGQRVKVFVTGVEETPRGPRVLVSRTHPALVSALFEQEVPEIQAGTVEIKSIAREAGSRTKIAVAANQAGIDPVGSSVGGRGARVQAVLAEIGNEKIDIVLWDDDPKTMIVNSLSPAKVEEVRLFEDSAKALVSVPEDQLSLAIGRAGQNVRLASRLTGWSIDIAATGKEDEKLKEIEGKAKESKVSQTKTGESIEAVITAPEEVVTDETVITDEPKVVTKDDVKPVKKAKKTTKKSTKK